MTIVFASMFVVLKIAAVSKSVGIPPALTSCITLAGFVYVSCLIPGVLGLLYTDIVYGIFFALCVAVVLLPFENNQSLSTRGTGECDKNTKFTVLDVCLVGIGLLGAIPLLTYLRSGFYRQCDILILPWGGTPSAIIFPLSLSSCNTTHFGRWTVPIRATVSPLS